MTSVIDNVNQLPPLRVVIDEHDLRAKKSLGQNFLLDQNVTDRIVKSAGDITEGTTVEIGPGPGGLTRSILRAGAKSVIALEFDPRAVKALQSLVTASEGHLEVLQADALKTDLLTLTVKRPLRIIANLPYNIATPLLIGWLKQIYENPNDFESMTLMFQKEVGDRILADHGSKIYGRLSIISQWICNVNRAYNLPPNAFVPPPKVHSSVIHFRPKHIQGVDKPNIKLIEKLTEKAFSQRRKMIRSSLKDYIGAVEKSGIATTLRAEQLTLDDFISIANNVDT